MGYWNASQAVLRATELQLNHRAARLLFWMALSALDEPGRDGAPARRYSRGRDHLSLGVGYDASAAQSPEARTAVKRSLAELRAAGVVETVVAGGGAPGRTAVFALNLPAKPAAARFDRLEAS